MMNLAILIKLGIQFSRWRNYFGHYTKRFFLFEFYISIDEFL